MSKTIQSPLACRNAHCGAMCSIADAEDMFTFFGGNPNKCPNYERRDDLYRQTELLDKVKKAREEIAELVTPPQYHDEDYYLCGVEDCLEILDKLIESEE